MKRAEIVTQWAGLGTASSPYHPLLADHYPLSRWDDVTGQACQRIPPRPNLLVVYVECADETLAAIGSDARYVGCVLWIADGAEDGVPSAAEFASLRDGLARLGATVQEVDEAVGIVVGARTRRQLARDLRAWLKRLNKA